jgi:hypothetical protein
MPQTALDWEKFKAEFEQQQERYKALEAIVLSQQTKEKMALDPPVDVNMAKRRIHEAEKPDNDSDF